MFLTHEYCASSFVTTWRQYLLTEMWIFSLYPTSIYQYQEGVWMLINGFCDQYQDIQHYWKIFLKIEFGGNPRKICSLRIIAIVRISFNEYESWNS